MGDQIGATNYNWIIDQNSRNKNLDKFEGNFMALIGENDFLKNQEYFHKDNPPHMPTPNMFFGNYDYLPQILFDNIYANQRDNPVPMQEYGYQYQESVGHQGDANIGNIGTMPNIGNIKLGQDLNYINYHLTGIMPPVDNIQNLFVPHRYSIPFLHPTKRIIKQQDQYLQKQEQLDYNGIMFPHQNYYPYSPYPSEYDAQNPPPSFTTQITKVTKRSKLTIGGITTDERRQKINLYLQKKKKRTYVKKIFYNCRKKVADQRIRVKGRFITKQAQIKAQDYQNEQKKQDQFDLILEKREERQTIKKDDSNLKVE